MQNTDGEIVLLSNKVYKFYYKDFKPEIDIVNPILENHRYKVYRKFEQDFIDFFMNKKLNKNIPPNKQRVKVYKAFGRWIMLQISFGYNSKDPLIPVKLSKESFAQLEEDIRNFTRDKTVDYDSLIRELDMENRCVRCITDIETYIKSKDLQTFDKRIKIDVSLNKDTGMYSLSCGEGRVVEASKLIHDRIKILFITNQSFSQNINHEEVFYYLLYCLMLRYITISEDGVRQGAKNQPFFDALHNEFGINFEGFAASFAASNNYICSLFYDIEKYFGSYGNFFDINPIKGFYQVNPPLDSLITVMAMKRVMEILEKDSNEEMLGFACFIPTWDHETIKRKGYAGKLELYDDFPVYYEIKKNKHLIMNYDVLNKKIVYVQYQGKFQELGTYDCPHILILGNSKFRDWFNSKKMENLLEIFVKTSF